MGKILLWAVVILGVMLAARVLAHAKQKQNSSPRPRQPGRGRSAGQSSKQAASGAAAQGASAEPMVRCAHCGIHLPRSEAVLRGGQTWCSDEHARLNAP